MSRDSRKPYLARHDRSSGSVPSWKVLRPSLRPDDVDISAKISVGIRGAAKIGDQAEMEDTLTWLELADFPCIRAFASGRSRATVLHSASFEFIELVGGVVLALVALMMAINQEIQTWVEWSW